MSELTDDVIDNAEILPDAVVAGLAAYSDRVYDERGQAHPVTLLVLLFQVDDTGGLGRQTFVLDDQARHALRASLKNPTPLPTPNAPESQEDTPQ